MSRPANLDELLKETLNTEDPREKISEFFKLLYRKPEDCEDDDCDEVVCPDCKGALATVFGTLPLEVRCKVCKKKFTLREILTPSP